jgi:energy-coupling factor transport system substrate-specific component
MQKTKQKKKSKKKTKQVVIALVRQRLDLKQSMKAFLVFLTLTMLAIMGRIALQGIPSVETITPFSILAGFVLGPIYGLFSGISGFYLSNFFVFGGHGPWTLFQCFGAGLAGLLAGLFGKIRKSSFKLFAFTCLIGIIVYELSVNIGWALMFGLIGVPIFIITSLPFSAVHLLSSLGLCSFFWKMRNRLPREKKIIEKKIFGFKLKEGEKDEMKEIYFTYLKDQPLERFRRIFRSNKRQSRC